MKKGNADQLVQEINWVLDKAHHLPEYWKLGGALLPYKNLDISLMRYPRKSSLGKNQIDLFIRLAPKVRVLEEVTEINTVDCTKVNYLIFNYIGSS